MTLARMLAALEAHVSGPGIVNVDQEWSDALEFVDSAQKELLRVAIAAERYMEMKGLPAPKRHADLADALIALRERLSEFEELVTQEDA